MFKFNPEKLRTELVWIKSISTALGGSIRVIDEAASTKAGFQVAVRIPVPFAIARQVKKSSKAAGLGWMVPRKCCVVWYDDLIVSIEVKTSSTVIGAPQEWAPMSETMIRTQVLPKTSIGDWYTDGAYLYTIPSNLESRFDDLQQLTEDGVLRGLTVQCIAFKHLTLPMLMDDTHSRSVVVGKKSNGQLMFTPPVWKNIFTVRSLDGGQTVKNRFDIIDNTFTVNLEFALHAGKVLGKLFGTQYLQPLRLADLMVKLVTVNLPRVSRTTRETFGISMSFNQTIGWLMGLSSKCDTMSEYHEVRGLFKMLLTKGLFDQNTNDKARSIKGIPKVMTTESAVDDVKSRMSPQQIQDYWMKYEGANARKREKQVDLTRDADHNLDNMSSSL